ncbi:hypothetical protein [Aurantimonas coralicida]|uniref:hypothetical protein n=1 Tax=Aurantimonas coralicida TaxID=182270 RepID=UPI001E5F11E6|nr:hypothetical protein [Aurantimonas coralicida]MCD1642473.1 hypothetical protein [Aurantimonas coralicida]
MNMPVTTAPVGSPITTAIARIHALDAAAVNGLPDATMNAITDEIAGLWRYLADAPCGTAAELAAKLRLVLAYVEGDRGDLHYVPALLDGLADDWDAVQAAA